MPITKSELVKQLSKTYPNLLKKDLEKFFDIFVNEINAMDLLNKKNIRSYYEKLEFISDEVMGGKSTGDEIELLLNHENMINSKGEPCEHKQVVRVLIDDIQVFHPEGHETKFQLDDKVGIQMKYPYLQHD